MCTIYSHWSSRLSGIVGDAPIGLLDDPRIRADGSIHHVVFVPFDSSIGTTTLIRRLCGVEPKEDETTEQSSGINGYRAVWEIVDGASGEPRYKNLFLWDISNEARKTVPQIVDQYISTAEVIVFLIPKSQKQLLKEITNFRTSKGLSVKRCVIVITKCDIIDQNSITPNDVKTLLGDPDKTLVVETSTSIEIDKLVKPLEQFIPK